MARNDKKLDLKISESLERDLGEMAQMANTSEADILRRGLAVMKAFREQKALGRKHLGFVSDASNLDVEIVNVL